MKVSLLFPPICEPYMPYLTVPWLATYLQSRGVQVVQRDLNIETYQLFLSEEFLGKSLARAKKALGSLEAKPALSEDELFEYQFLVKVVSSGDYILDKVDDAKKVYTSEEFYDPTKLLESHKLLNYALRLAVAPWYPASLSLGDFGIPYYSIFNKAQLLQGVYSDRHNPFRDVFKTYYLDSILAEKPDLLGITIAIWQQIIPALTLAALVKEAASDVHVCIGGQIPSRWEDMLPEMDEFFQCFDSVIVREGEIPLFELAMALEEGSGLQDVPNLAYWDGSRVRRNHISEELADINALPTPSFDGMPLDLYLLPELILPLFTQRGCYWGKCAFCDHLYGFENYYVARDLDLVINDIHHLSNRYGTKLFSFSDENTPPPRLIEFSEKVLEADLDVEWLLPLRFEKEYTPEICSLLRRAGCRLVMWGMESACQRVLDAMEKGTQVELNETILKSFAKEGIWNQTAIVLGYPSEEREEAKITIDYLTEHTDFIHGVFDNVFTLVPWSVAAHEPERFGFVKMERESMDLALFEVYYPFTGMLYDDAKAAQTVLLDRLRQAHSNFDFWHDLTWFHTLLYLKKKGYDRVTRMRLEVTPSEIPDDGWEKAIIKLKDGVFQVTRSFDGKHVIEGMAEKGQFYSWYDLSTDKLFFASSEAKNLLRYCQEGKSLGEIVSLVSASKKSPVEKVKAGYVSFVNGMLARGLFARES